VYVPGVEYVWEQIGGGGVIFEIVTLIGVAPAFVEPIES
jgi:hypothetical protein